MQFSYATVKWSHQPSFPRVSHPFSWLRKRKLKDTLHDFLIWILIDFHLLNQTFVTLRFWTRFEEVVPPSEFYAGILKRKICFLWGLVDVSLSRNQRNASYRVNAQINFICAGFFFFKVAFKRQKLCSIRLINQRRQCDLLDLIRWLVPLIKSPWHPEHLHVWRFPVFSNDDSIFSEYGAQVFFFLLTQVALDDWSEMENIIERSGRKIGIVWICAVEKGVCHFLFHSLMWLALLF